MPGTANEFRRFIASLGGRRLPILITSAGGSVPDAMAMGRLIRAKKLAVAVSRTLMTPCESGAANCPVGEARGTALSFTAFCVSACPLVLAGGVERFVRPAGGVGVHQITVTTTKTQVYRSFRVTYRLVDGRREELSRTLVSEHKSTSTSVAPAAESVDEEIRAYLEEMGIDAQIMPLMLATPASSIHWMTQEELTATRLVTFWIAGGRPIAIGNGANGLAGVPADAVPSHRDTVEASRTSPLSGTINGHPTALETTFAYRRGGSDVQATFALPDQTEHAPEEFRHSGLFFILYPEGAEFAVRKSPYFEPLRATVSLANFCRLRHSGLGVVSFVDDSAAPAPHEPPIAIDLRNDASAKALFDEACIEPPLDARRRSNGAS